MEFFRGDTFEFDFSSKSADGSNYIFEPGDSLKIGVKEKLSNSRYSLFRKVNITEETDKLTITFNPEETKRCHKGIKILEVELTDKDGKVRTLFQDKLTVKEDLINE